MADGNAPTTSLGFIEEMFAPLPGRRLLDIGCGAGALARALAERDADVTGIDPAPDAIAAARNGVPGVRFEVCAAERLPFPDRSFAGAIFLNALHHIPAAAMADALGEAARVVGPRGIVVVIEPLTTGTFFDVLRLVEDETEVRRGAQAALSDAVRSGGYAPLRDVTYVREDIVASLDALLARVAAVNPSREAAIAANRAEVARAFAAAARRRDDGQYVLEQPMRAIALRALVPLLG